MTKQIQLTQGKVSLVDDNMFDFLNQWKWAASRNKKSWYAQREDHGKTVLMHRLIMNASEDVDIDHRDRDGLNNQRHNLRECTVTQNNRNRSMPNSTGYKGVTWDEGHKKFKASIKVNGRSINLGRFTDPLQAALAYDRAADQYHGDFANKNF